MKKILLKVCLNVFASEYSVSPRKTPVSETLLFNQINALSGKMQYSYFIICACLLSVLSHAHAEFSGQVGAELRAFPRDAQYSDQFNNLQGSIYFEPEWRHYIGEHLQTVVIPYLRLDGRDSERTHADLREGYALYRVNEWEFLLGVNREFWGVTESRHLINIINQVDSVDNIDEEDFLGQLMFNASAQYDIGRFDVYLMPHFRERTFAGDKGRLRAGLPVDISAARYQHDDEQWHNDWALRYSHYLGDWDVGVSLFTGTSREPRLIPAESGRQLIPYYDQIEQLGLELQYTQDAWLWKFEGLVRAGQGHTFLASVAGFEYIFYQVFNSGADIGLLLEHLYDGRDTTQAPVTLFNNDLFVGLRYSLNDMQDTLFLAGIMSDLENESGSLRVEAERRIGNSLKVEIETQLFINASNDAITTPFKQDNFFTLRLSQYF